MFGSEVLKEHYLTWKALSRVSCVVMVKQTSHRSPRKCLTDVALAGKHLSCLSQGKKQNKTNHSLSSTFRENKQICIDKPRMCTPWEMTICTVKGKNTLHRRSRASGELVF